MIFHIQEKINRITLNRNSIIPLKSKTRIFGRGAATRGGTSPTSADAKGRPVTIGTGEIWANGSNEGETTVGDEDGTRNGDGDAEGLGTTEGSGDGDGRGDGKDDGLGNTKLL